MKTNNANETTVSLGHETNLMNSQQENRTKKAININSTLLIAIVVILATTGKVQLGLRSSPNSSGKTITPTMSPSSLPTQTPTLTPTNLPSLRPTPLPTENPTFMPTISPSPLPSYVPTDEPSRAPSLPTTSPTASPTTLADSLCQTAPEAFLNLMMCLPDDKVLVCGTDGVGQFHDCNSGCSCPENVFVYQFLAPIPCVEDVCIEA
eukprot:snap_masked-scaffold_75-processed-gene-0.12-mRNA-1 protein AED:0.31 eAED:0.31 QI:0/0/0/0.5/1/1/2/0/206